ncbi:MAG: FAD-dependent oxidoreductase [Oligoflexia bacterium]|nr:FAD-dependent oxidoreductase [Oligoflexia bacterium]
MKRVAIIGAGVGGLTTALLLAKKGYQVTIFESHYYVGGCASFFKRGKFRFDVGATTLSGFRENSFLENFLKENNIDLITKDLEIPMTIYGSGKKIRRYKNREHWHEELKKHWPDIDHDQLWREVENLSDLSWDNLDLLNSLPPTNLKKALSLGMKLKTSSTLGINSFKTLGEKLLSKNITNQEYLKFLDEQLIISTQTKTSEVNYLLSTLGLTYPEDMKYCEGGVSELSLKILDKLIEGNVKIQMRTHVNRVKKMTDFFELTYELKKGKGIFQKEKFDYVISNLPLQNTAKIYENKKLVEKSENYIGEYSALTFYVATENFLKDNDSLYHQYHYEKDELIESESGSLFISVSAIDDRLKAPDGYQTFTASTHFKNFNFEMSETEYLEFKNQISEKFIKILKKVFPDMSFDFRHFEMGTPKTFVHFTKRHEGLVGGLPHKIQNHPLIFPKNNMLGNGFFLVGDNVFPGQGIVSVMLGAQNLVDENF